MPVFVRSAKFPALAHNGGGTAGKGLRVISYQVTRKVEAG
jgi:hypothetical protein